MGRHVETAKIQTEHTVLDPLVQKYHQSGCNNGPFIGTRRLGPTVSETEIACLSSQMQIPVNLVYTLIHLFIFHVVHMVRKYF